MKNILKQLEEWVIGLKNNKIKIAYLKIIFGFLLSSLLFISIFTFSIYYLFISDIKLEKINKYTPDFVQKAMNTFDDDQHIYEKEKYEKKEEDSEKLFAILLFLDTIILFLIFSISHLIAKKTLKPLMESEEKQKKFISNVSHELRTPLAIMKSALELESSKYKDDEKYSNFLEEQKDEINYLIKISNDLIYLSSLEYKDIKKNMRNENVSNLLEETVNSFFAYAREKKVKIELDIQKNIFFKFNKTDFKKIVYNLLKNSIDYNKKGGYTLVSLKTKNKKIILSVKDNGIGINKKNQNFIFDRFYKINKSRNNKVSSSGLGLSIVSEIVKEYSGIIKLKSEEKEGTEVVITF